MTTPKRDDAAKSGGSPDNRVSYSADTAIKPGPFEPVLEMKEIQGTALPGFFKPHQTLIYCTVGGAPTVLNAFNHFVRTLDVATAEYTLKDRREFRQSNPGSEERRRSDERVLVGIGFTYQGLLKLTPSAFAINSPAFKHGLAARSSLLGDPSGQRDEGNPANWVVGGAGQEMDALIIVAGAERARVSHRAAELVAHLQGIGVDAKSEDGDIRADEKGHEHFGFDDGVSQPGIRGRASDDRSDFVTDRAIDPHEIPAAWLYGNPGQDLVWPGEFIIGYPATSPDPLIAGPIMQAKPDWTRNGSFLVYRRLRQDVGLFWRTLRDEAARIAHLPGFAHLTDDHLAALLVGRWKSGAPVNRVPSGDNAALGDDPVANNNFRFDSDTPKFKLVKGSDAFPPAKADAAGTTCPWGAHIKKVNVRDSSSDMGARSATLERRILRVGVPFGESLRDRYADNATDPQQGNRGLLFLSVQSSIEEQFEFLQTRWMNDDARPKTPGGNDMIVGQNAAAADGIRRCGIFGDGFAQAEVRAERQWVIPTGGGYFFVPSVSALRGVLTQAVDATVNDQVG